MSCVLCLELSEDPAANVNINSTEGQELDIRCTIEKHFSWLKDDIAADSCICRLCWKALLTFHKFYQRVERAHKLLECDLKPSENCEFSEQLSHTEAAPMEKEDAKVEVGQIKIEPESICLEAVKPKRRQGRPRKNKLVEESVEVTRATRRRAVSASKQDTKIEEFYVPTVKDENMEVEGVLAGVDVLKSGNVSEAEAQSAGLMSTDDNLEEADDLVALKKSSKKILTSRQSDEYIAKHFRLSCNICSVELDDFSTLRSHFRKEHKVRGYVLCCGKKLLNRCLLVDHLHMHEDPAYFSCPRCGKELANRNCLELHMQRHGEKRERKYECEICHKKFFLSSACRRHMLLHLPEEKKTVACPECGKNFATQSVMTEHLRMVHLNVYAKICDICGKSLVGREALRRHLEEHSGVPRPAKKCELCGVTLSSELGLARHMKAIHLEENRQPQVCPICSKVSPGLRAHKHHMNYMHNMQRKHVCPMCSKAFKRPTDLKEHMTTHTGEVLYTCPHCPKTFNSNANMHSHRKKVHRKEWEEKRSQRISQVPQKAETPETLPS